MASNGKERLRITRLRLERWRNFDAVDIPLQGRAFFVGPNASGKSNLLDAIRFLRDIAGVGGGLEAAVQRRGGMHRVANMAASPGSDVLVGVEIGTSDAPSLWRYELRFGAGGDAGPAVVVSERVFRDADTLLDRPDRDDQADPQRLHQTHLEQVSANQAFRTLTTFFASVDYVHVVPELVRGRGSLATDSRDILGHDLIDRLAAGDETSRTERLDRIAAGLRQALPQLQRLVLEQNHRGGWVLKGRFDHWHKESAWQTDEHFSDGTLRLLGMLWAVVDGGGPLLLEEPELSLHADVTRHLPAMFANLQRNKRRQVLLSTHAEAMLSDPGIGLNEVFVLLPGPQGTQVEILSDRQDVRLLVEGGLTIGEAVLPMLPVQAHRLGLLGD